MQVFGGHDVHLENLTQHQVVVHSLCGDGCYLLVLELHERKVLRPSRLHSTRGRVAQRIVKSWVHQMVLVMTPSVGWVLGVG
jgi:hypothetical protein